MVAIVICVFVYFKLLRKETPPVRYERNTCDITPPAFDAHNYIYCSGKSEDENVRKKELNRALDPAIESVYIVNGECYAIPLDPDLDQWPSAPAPPPPDCDTDNYILRNNNQDQESTEHKIQMLNLYIL